MDFRKFAAALLHDVWTLPTKDAFLKSHVVPAKDDDRFNDNKCAQCWEEYTKVHPGVKIPCGHIFGRDCLHEMIKGPTGDLCPLCRVKLFRKDRLLSIAVRAMLIEVCDALRVYWLFITGLFMGFHSWVCKQSFWRKKIITLVLDGPRVLVSDVIRNYSDICDRNPRLRLEDMLGGLAPGQLLYLLVCLAPLFLVVYCVTGLMFFKVFLTVFDLMVTLTNQYLVWTEEVVGQIDHQDDRPKLVYAAIIAVLLKEHIVIWLIWISYGWLVSLCA